MTIQHILIVDDSKTETLFLSDLLQRNGYVVQSAEDAATAMACLLQQRPDLILMDVVMPGQNGFQLTRTITRTPEYADIPIILCTSKSQETDRVWGMRQGASAYLTKPLDAADLLTKIRMLG